jgi:hypothetical protein
MKGTLGSPRRGVVGGGGRSGAAREGRRDAGRTAAARS